MCWIPITLGALMVVVGVVLLVRFFAGHGVVRPEVATPARTESVLVGAALTSVGTLMLALGITGAICQWLGIS
jgi:hypothetical protein